MIIGAIAIVYLLVGLFGCGAHCFRVNLESLEHQASAYLCILLFWPLLVAFAFGSAMMENRYK